MEITQQEVVASNDLFAVCFTAREARSLDFGKTPRDAVANLLENDEPPTLHVDYINPRNITIPLANEKDDSFPLCPRCKTSSQMRLNPSNLRFTCDECKTTWSRQYLKGWNDGYRHNA